MKVKNSYPNGACPDCQTTIPDAAPNGWTCPNCEHACFIDLLAIQDKCVKVRWLKDLELEVVTNYEVATDTPETEMEIIHKDAEDEVDIYGIDPDNNTVDMQFGNGSVAISVSTELFDIVEE